MSFSSQVKNELARHLDNTRHCKIAEIAALINMCGEVLINKENKISIKFQTENAAVARKYFTLIKKTFNINTEVLIRKNTKFKKNKIYVLFINKTKDAKKVLQATGLILEKNGQIIKRQGIYPLIVQSTCCKRAYIRGAFLGAGSLSDPEKTYHLEFVNQNINHSEDLKQLINLFEMDAKIVKRKKYYVVYLKEGSQIVDLLNIMGAHIALMDLENVRIIKEMRNNVNRIVNCETANLKKTVSAAIKQIEDIKVIDKYMGLSSLPKALEDVARFRVQYAEASLKELGAMLDPPVGKSGVNHRLRKISRIADQLREQKGGSI
ncbi:DNA-binding protein WhiA [Defluviitalea phaphyphila]|uniref:DNA-binding protein WhiA n=1 Tax=Defluviitalea phaphyphila TaxID=1473580 RepID=UPI0007310DFE|nr:DNA-binding protein WhiA [Defluviitalea phaphyphila]